MLAVTARHSQAAPFSMQMLGHKTPSDGQAKPETGNLPAPSGSTPNAKTAPLNSETPHEISGQLL